MHRGIRTLALAAVCTTTAGLLAGCGASNHPADVSSPSFGSNATGVVKMWDRNTTAPFGRRLVADFNRTHKNLKVELTSVQDGQYVTKLATAIRSGTEPDVVGIDDINSQLFIYNKAFLDLTPVVSTLPYLKQLSPGQLHLTTENGHYYGTPYVADLSLLWYNKALFAKAGLDPAKPPATFADMLTDARAVNRLGHGVSGIATAGNCTGCLGFVTLPQIWAPRDYIIRGEPGSQKISIVKNSALRKTLTLYHTMYAEKLLSPSSRTQSGATWGKDFIAGTVGLLPGGYGTVMQTATPAQLKDLAVTPLPGPDGGYSTFDGGANFGIPKHAKNASGAWEFMRYALSKTEQVQAPEAGFTPVRTDVLNAAYQKKYPYDAVAIEALKRGYAPKTTGYNETFNQAGGPWQSMYIKGVYDGDIAGALTAGQKAFSLALDQAQT